MALTQSQKDYILQGGVLNTGDPVTQAEYANFLGANAAGGPANQSITSAIFGNQNTPAYVTPVALPVPSVAALDSSSPAPMVATIEEAQAQDWTKQIQEINNSLIGESALRTKKENDLGLPDLLKTQTDLSSRLKSLQNESLQIPLQLQQEATGRGITTGGLQPIQTAALRNNAIQALGVSSLLEASRGNIALANDLVDRAINAEFDPLKEKQKVLTANLELLINSPAYTLAEKNRATKQLAIENDRTKAIEKAATDKTEVKNTANLAVKYGLTDQNIIKKISEASTPEEALRIAAPYLQDPKAKAELEGKLIDNALKKAQTLQTEKETQLLGTPNPTPADKKAIAESLKNAKASIPVMQDKIAIIDALINNSGLNSRVGASPLGRIPLLDAVTGAGQNFSGSIHQLVSGLTLDNLIAAKARGATFGALSEGELGILAASATKIKDWEIKDTKGQGMGFWNIDEGSFRDELKVIQDYTRKALAAAGESLLAEDENTVLDDVYSNVAEDLNFNPAEY